MGWVASVAALAWIASCASGFDSDPTADAWTNFGSAGQAPPQSTGGSGGHTTAGAMFTGESCTPGSSGLCDCEKPGSRGTRTCRMDTKSPSGGSWGPCGACVDAPPPKFDPGDVTATATGGRGGLRGGIGGLSGGSGSGSGGSGGAMSSGSGGMRGSRGDSGRDRGGSMGGGNCACDDTVCFPVGILPCCRIDGSCGCTWAPGAYCL
jgi:hypothetical protein